MEIFRKIWFAKTLKNCYPFTVLVTVFVTIQKLVKRYHTVWFLLIITFLPLFIKKSISSNIERFIVYIIYYCRELRKKHGNSVIL